LIFRPPPAASWLNACATFAPAGNHFLKRSHKVIVALTVPEILDEHIAKKLA